MTKTKKLLTTALLASTAAGAAVAAGPALAAQSDNPYTMQGLCGSQYQEAGRWPVTYQSRHIGDTVLGRRADGGLCAVTLKYARVGEPTRTSITFQRDNAVLADDTGLYTYYAGPIRSSVKGCFYVYSLMQMPDKSSGAGGSGRIGC